MKNIIVLSTLFIICQTSIMAQCDTDCLDVKLSHVGNNASSSFCEDVDLQLNDGDNMYFSGNCLYEISDSALNPGSNQLMAKADVGAPGSISTIDLVYLLKALTIDGFVSPYEAISADVDGDNVVTTDDIITLRNFILGINLKLPYHARIAREDHPFVDLNQLDLGSNFTSIEFGDDEASDLLDLILVNSGDLSTFH